MVWQLIRILFPFFFLSFLCHTEDFTARFSHNTAYYTQGFFFRNGYFYESAGNYGESLLAVYTPQGKIIKTVHLPDDCFGEGIAFCNGKIVQLTWKRGCAYVYNENLDQIGYFTYSGEGWGLTSDGKSFIMSDGTDRIFFRNPDNFYITRTIQVKWNNKPVNRLNELEYIEGNIYANIWFSKQIAVINPADGIVLKMIDASTVCSGSENRKEGYVLNGIAYDSHLKKIYVTGKKWDTIYEFSGARK